MKFCVIVCEGETRNKLYAETSMKYANVSVRWHFKILSYLEKVTTEVTVLQSENQQVLGISPKNCTVVT